MKKPDLVAKRQVAKIIMDRPANGAHRCDVDYILPLDKIAAKLIKPVADGIKTTKSRTTGKRNRTPVAGNRLRPSYAAESKAAMVTRKP